MVNDMIDNVYTFSFSKETEALCTLFTFKLYSSDMNSINAIKNYLYLYLIPMYLYLYLHAEYF